MAILVSVIIPVYNVEKYISKCLLSILDQTYSDFEVIIVDDGSTDSSGSICDDFCTKDKRFKVYHKDNGGVSSARNYALKQAHGEWIYFCDADDVLYNDALETLIKNIRSDIDIVCAGYVQINPEYSIIKKTNTVESAILPIEDTLKDFYKPRHEMFNGFIWNRLFKLSIIRKYKLEFREDIYVKEDGLFLVQYLCKCKGFCYYTTKPVYKYLIHNSSTMNTVLNTINPKSISRLIATLECYKEIKRNNYINVLYLARYQVFFARKKLLDISSKKGISKVLSIDFQIVKHCPSFIKYLGELYIKSILSKKHIN